MLLELAIGDAYGAAFEFVPQAVTHNHVLARYQRHPKHALVPGTYTDDTQMSLALAELLIADEPFSRESVAEHFVSAFSRDPRKGYARGFFEFLTTVRDGTDFLSRIVPTSEKNGAAMRATPLGLHQQTELVVEQAVLQARLTHDTEQGTGAAVASALLCHYLAWRLGPKQQLPAYLAKFVPQVDWSEPWTGAVGVSGYDAVRAALTALLQGPDLAAVLQRCVRFGGDVDTVSAIALSAGAMCEGMGWELPDHLVSGLERGPFGLSYLWQMEQRLLSHYGFEPRPEAVALVKEVFGGR